jgi:hypothetical protein
MPVRITPAAREPSSAAQQGVAGRPVQLGRAVTVELEGALAGDEQMRALGCDRDAALDARAVAGEPHRKLDRVPEPPREPFEEPRGDVLDDEQGDGEPGR